jgi:hypothetical protein
MTRLVARRGTNARRRPPYRDEVLADSPVAYWELEETTSGSVIDSSGNGYDGTPGSSTAAPTVDVDGIVGRAYQFDGSNDRFEGTTLGSFGPNLVGSFTVEFWVKTTETSSQSIMGFFNTGNNLALQVRINTNGTEGTAADSIYLFVRSDDSSTGRIMRGTFPAAVSDDEWHHVVIAVDDAQPSGTVRAYLDGANETFTKETDNLGTGTANLGFALGVGARNVRGTFGTFFAGRLDEVAIYPTALSAARVDAHWKAGRP